LIVNTVLVYVVDGGVERANSYSLGSSRWPCRHSQACH